MEVYALFDNGKSESINLEFLQPTSKGNRVDIIFLNDVPDNVMHSADNGIKEAFISLISHVNDLPEKISIWFKGFESDYCGNSTDLAFAMALYSQFVNEGYLRNSLSKDKIFATGVIDKKGNIKRITGLEGKIRAALDVLSDDESGILLIPYDNRPELVEIMEKNKELNTARNKKNMEISYVKSVKDLLNAVDVKKRKINIRIIRPFNLNAINGLLRKIDANNKKSILRAIIISFIIISVAYFLLIKDINIHYSGNSSKGNNTTYNTPIHSNEPIHSNTAIPANIPIHSNAPIPTNTPLQTSIDTSTNTPTAIPAQWVRRADCLFPVTGAGIEVHKNKIYVFNYSSANNSVLEYDIKNDTWLNKNILLNGRFAFQTVKSGNEIYCIGGWHDSFKNSVEAYNPDENTWYVKSSMGTPREQMALAGCNGKIYAFGGKNTDLGILLDVVEEYDPKTDKWVRKSNMPTKRSGLKAVTIMGKIYVIGGVVSGKESFCNMVEVYDPKKDKWYTCKGMNEARAYFGVTTVKDKKIYVFSGRGNTNSGFVNSIEEYDVDKGIWRIKSTIGTPRSGLSAVSYGEKIYVVGGDIGSNSFNTFEEYSP